MLLFRGGLPNRILNLIGYRSTWGVESIHTWEEGPTPDHTSHPQYATNRHRNPNHPPCQPTPLWRTLLLRTSSEVPTRAR